MEDYAMLLEIIIKEMNSIAKNEITDIKKLSQLIDSAKQYVNSPNKGAFTQALNTTRRYVSAYRRYVTPLNELLSGEKPSSSEEVRYALGKLEQSITRMAMRYCKHVMSL